MLRLVLHLKESLYQFIYAFGGIQHVPAGLREWKDSLPDIVKGVGELTGVVHVKRLGIAHHCQYGVHEPGRTAQSDASGTAPHPGRMPVKVVVLGASEETRQSGALFSGEHLYALVLDDVEEVSHHTVSGPGHHVEVRIKQMTAFMDCKPREDVYLLRG